MNREMGNPQLAALLVVSIAIAAANARSIVPAGPGQTCGFKGNGDVYGLGIRLGVYIQVGPPTSSRFLTISLHYIVDRC